MLDILSSYMPNFQLLRRFSTLVEVHAEGLSPRLRMEDSGPYLRLGRSPGQGQRVPCARARARRPPLSLTDNPPRIERDYRSQGRGCGGADKEGRGCSTLNLTSLELPLVVPINIKLTY